MSRINVVVSVPVPHSYRVARVQGQFDIPACGRSEFSLVIDVPLETVSSWQIGLITGGSGRGKSLLARQLFGRVYLPSDLDWHDCPLVDAFPDELNIQQIIDCLTAVGLSSTPAWLRPYRVLSVGEQFRAAMARLLLTAESPIVIDEFTSVVDRTVARAVSVALARHIRRSNKQMVAVTCHKDIIPWLAPDWVVDLDESRFFRFEGAGKRPAYRLRVYPGSLAAWPMFRGYHYLSQEISKVARVFLATVTFPDENKERLCGFFSIIPQAGMAGWWRGHRTVVLPDFQGLGIGNRMVELTADWLWETERKRYRATTLAPNLIKYRLAHPDRWILIKQGSQAVQAKRPTSLNRGRARQKTPISTSAGRLTTTWEYIPRALREQGKGDAGEVFKSVSIQATERSLTVGRELRRAYRFAGVNLQVGKRPARSDGSG